MNRSWTVFSIVVLLHVVIYVGFVGDGWLQQGFASERSMNQRFFTPDVSISAEARATDWFTRAFVDTGVVGTLYNAWIPTPEDRQKVGMENFAGSLFTWWEGRLRTWWTVVHLALVRMSHLLLWWPYALFFILPWVVDGWVQRRIKKTNFGFASPLRHRLSLYLLQIIVVGYFIAIFLPFPMPPVAIPVLLLVTGIGLGKVFAEFAKQA